MTYLKDFFKLLPNKLLYLTLNLDDNNLGGEKEDNLKYFIEIL